MTSGKLHRGALILSAVVAASVFAAAGCGGGSSDDAAKAPTKPASTAAAAGATTAPTTAAAAAGANLGAKFSGSIPAGAAVIDQKELQFKPDKLTVKAGDTVYFSNSEAALHSVNVDGKNILGQGANMKQGESATWKPAKAGAYNIACDYHPAMKAVITVQ